ncbi:hypothetical protein P8452_52830 [Trifolium repens]|nr:hypothetical protein P8452_52830 [Trifolium repens]
MLDDEKIWLNIWKLKITERNTCFMWLVKHNRMGLGSACCDYCGHEETSLHVLRDFGQQHACHWLWYWRNMEQHNNNFMRPTNAGYHAL